MPVQTTTARVQYATNGTTGPWSIPFYFLADADVRVVYTDSAGDETELALTTDYSLTGEGVEAGGTCTTVSSYVAGGTITILRAVEALQPSDYSDTDAFPAATLERNLDRLTMLGQRVLEATERSLTFPVSDETSPALPSAATRANTTLGFDADGAPTVLTPTSGSAADVLTRLADAVDPAKGAALIGYDSLLDYGSGKTAGAALSGAGRILQGADPTGVTDNTALLKALFDVCIPAGEKAILPAGTYNASGPITSSSYPAGSLHIHCAGDVTIEVDPASTAFSRLIQCETTAAGNVTVTGGRLTLNCNNKAGSGLYCRHYGSGGSVVIDNVRVTDAKHDTAAVVENAGVYLFGRWDSGKIGTIEVDGVDRAGGGTAARGVLIAGIQGPFTAESIKVANVLSTGYTVDADGVFLSGYTSGASTTQRAGSFTIGRLEVSDCQGRSLKAQHQDVSIRDCITRRQFVVSFDVLDIDFQLGGGSIDTLQLNYFKNGATSPLHANFYPLAAQQLCTDRACVTRIGNVVLRTEVQVQRLVQVVVGATALDSATYINGVEAVPYNGLTGSIFQRCAVEFDASQVAASSNKTHISVRNVRGNMNNVPIIGHTGYTTGVTDVSTKLSVECIDNENTGTAGANNRLVYPTSGNEVTQMLKSLFRDNFGFIDRMAADWTFDYKTLAVGTRFTYVRASATASNGPVIAAGTYVDVECVGAINDTSRKVRVTVDDAGTMGEHYTQSGAWGVIK